MLSAALVQELGELAEEPRAVAQASLKIYTKENFIRTPRMKVVLHHELEDLTVSVPDLIHELREGNAAGDQTLTCLARRELAQPPTGMPHDDAGDDVLDP